MKTSLLSFLFSLVAFAAAAQAWVSPLPIDSETQKVSYAGVAQAPLATQAEILSRAKEWFAAKFTDGETPLTLTATETGKLLGKGVTRVTWGTSQPSRSRRVWFVFTLEAKEGRYRYEFTDLENQNDYDAAVARASGLSREQLTVRSPLEKTYTADNKFSFDRRGRPTEALLQYTASLHQQMNDLVKSLQAAEDKKGKTDW